MITDTLDQIVKLHVGCGTLYKESWINIDNNSDNNIEKLDINHDLSTGLPFDDLTVDYIYNEHFIEHLSREDGLKFMDECQRVLKIGGVLRISCPDLDKIIDGYINNNWREQDWVKTYHYEWIESKCQMLNLNLNETPWGHKYVYNKEELISQLVKAGFNKEDIEEESFSHSLIADLKNIDTRADGMFFEAKKTNHLIKTQRANSINYTNFIQLFLEQTNGISEENSIKFPVSNNIEIQEFIFDLCDKQDLVNLRLDPLNEACVIEIEELRIINTDGSEINLIHHISANTIIQHGKSYFFDTIDPIIHFSSEDFSGAQKLIARIRYPHIAREALEMCIDQTKLEQNQTKKELEQTKEELEQTKEELEQTKEELEQVYASKSYRITKPLRKIQQLLKGNQ
jgi:predicted SAM-dependent methyltransferase